MANQWYAHYTGDYNRATGHLSLMEDGAYRRLLDHYYSTGKPLPAKALHLHRICKAVEVTEQLAVDYVAGEFFEKDGDVLRNKRADEEIEKAAIVSEKRSKAAKSRHAKAPTKAPAIADTTTTTTTDKKKKISAKAETDLILESLSPSRKALLIEWMKYKQEGGKGYKPTGLKSLIKKLSLYSDSVVGQSINDSMSNNWAGLFPDRIAPANPAAAANIDAAGNVFSTEHI